MNNGEQKCSRLCFSGTYNFRADDDEFAKVPEFIVSMLSDGARFFSDALGSANQLTTQYEITQHFEQRALDPWIGRLVLFPNVVQQVLESHTEMHASTPDWGTQLSAWLRVAREYPGLWITIDFPGRGDVATAIITYWTYRPSFVLDEHQDETPQAAPPVPVLDASKILVDDLYVAVDNLFSAFVFERGRFTYPQEELRKLSFTYIFQTTDPDKLLTTSHNTFRPLLSKTLLVSLAESLTANRILEHFNLIYATGFIGMTGQPDMGKTPDLQLLVGDVQSQHDDVRLTEILRSLSSVEKSGAHLTTISESYLPAIRNGVNQAQEKLREISGKSQQLLVDTDLATSSAQISLLADREALLSRELLDAINTVFEIRSYLSQFFSVSLNVKQDLLTIAEQWQLTVFHGSHSVTDLRVMQAERTLSSLINMETTLASTHEELHNLQVSVAGTRLAMRRRYSAIAETDTADDPDSALETCFVLMAFRPELDDIYREIVLEIFQENDFGLKCYRADEIFGTSSIIQDVWKAIRNARIVIAELTGRNPNVLYELGLTHVLRKPAILMVQSMDDVPFDLKHLRCIVYSLGPAGLRKLRTDLESTIKQVLSNPEREVVLFEP